CWRRACARAKPSATTASSSRRSGGDGARLDQTSFDAFDRAQLWSIHHRKDVAMLTLYYGPGACSMASHIVLEESGEKYEPKRMDLAKGEQRTPEYLKMNPQGRVPLLQLDNGD